MIIIFYFSGIYNYIRSNFSLTIIYWFTEGIFYVMRLDIYENEIDDFLYVRHRSLNNFSIPTPK